MQEGSFIWSYVEQQHRAVDKRNDSLWLVFLLLASVILFTVNLGGLPLQDGDEGIVATVAREILQAPSDSLRWLYPTLAGEPYHDKPPLIHWLVAGAYAMGGINEWTTRLPGALLMAISVPLLYCIGREIFRQRWAAIYSALIYLTMLPVVRYGRLAIMEGAIACFLMTMILCLLRSRRDLRYCLGVGISFGLICLTHGKIGLCLGVVTLIFLYWDTPRLLTCYYFWLAILIGCIPVGCWYGLQVLQYGYSFTEMDTKISLITVKSISNSHGKLPWYYLMEIAKWTWPWLIFLPATFRITWENNNFSWAKLLIVWFGVYLLLISLISIKLPWYILPIYPSLALAFGYQLTQIENLPLFSGYPRIWVTSLAILAVLASTASIYFSCRSTSKIELQIIFASVALTMTLAAILAERGDRQFLKILVWGSYLSLLLLMKSNFWIWELNTLYPVKPVAAMISRLNPEVTEVYTSFPYHRPSLDFYSDRTIIPMSVNQLQSYWGYHQKPYFLVNKPTLENLQLKSVRILDQAEDWQLITKDNN
ncbi:glycosyltransferase family 39 protein [Anabaena sp. FACHB-1237]|uniref:ArnT family glycosyltransferase n=1 Tax=Anabaena sp. FACHB-1237 TaxID=2692769 RepID=UPI00168094F6|nr:glycosyltransferase family 39 protein [Anabaena sp. FACHB-1237]MBD2138169.1 glycosyltransferase family 39 protein [Anabaena sp. FACHB-1237]